MKVFTRALVSFFCLGLLSLAAQAHTLTAAIATPDCDSKTIKLTFSGNEMESGDYRIDYMINFDSLDGQAAPAAISGSFEGNIPNCGGPGVTCGSFDNVMKVLQVPELAGRKLSVSGTATLFQPLDPVNGDTQWNTRHFNNGAAVESDCRTTPGVASLGDRVWEDLNGDGQQNCVDGGAQGGIADGIIGNAGDSGPECDEGVLGVKVTLGRPNGQACDATATMTETNDGGFYGFGNLTPGDYCVIFDKSTLPSNFCEATLPNGSTVNLGMPLFTKRNQGEDASDSDADPASGNTELVSLVAGDRNLTLDAGIVCPGKIGDYVWLDSDKDGTQDDGNTGVPDATVKLYTCSGELVGERKTDSSGLYMFGAEPDFDLQPGSYYLVFSDKDGRPFTTPNAGGNALDSDCNAHPDNIPGATACFDVQGSRAVDLTRDCGIVPPPPPQCSLLLDKQCRVETPPAPPFTGSCKGKLQQFTVIWDRDEAITVSGVANDSAGPINRGDAVTFFGPFPSNDVYVNVAGSPAGTQSVFHMSCSDDDFNGPEDCGKAAGDAKGKSGVINGWALEGFVDAENRVLACNSNPPDGPFSQSCSFEPSAQPTCETAGKPEMLTFQYLGGGCKESSNGQSADKAVCSQTGEVSGSVIVEAAGSDNFAKDLYAVNPGSVGADGSFDATFGGSSFKSTSFFRLRDSSGRVETNEIHTSCSQPLAVGDVFGSLKLVGINGQSGGVDVTYQYKVTNNGDALANVSVIDNPVGTIASGQALPAGAKKTYTALTRIFGTTTNTAYAESGECRSESDTVTVTAVIPPCSVGITLDGVDDDRIKFKLTNNDARNRIVTLSSMTVAFPAARGDLNEVKLDGGIYKRNDSNAPVSGTPATISPTGWTESDGSKRQLDPGETRTLEIKTTGKSSKDGSFDLTLVFAEGCEVLVSVSNQQIGPQGR